MTENAWINDERLSAISDDKKQFLNSLFFEMNQLSQEEKLPFIMALMSSGKLSSLSFESSELSVIIGNLLVGDISDHLRKECALVFPRQRCEVVGI